jgi:hypothetical protein
MLKGVPQQTTQQLYQAPGSLPAQLAGAGASIYGASKLFGAEGGLMGLGVHNLSKG